MKKIYIIILCFFATHARAQELYVYTEPASSMPAYSLGLRLTGQFTGPQVWHDRPMQRYNTEIVFGINKNWMLYAGGSFGDMHTSNFSWESVYLYTKYRFFTRDEVHRHFRMAAFAEASHTRVPFHNDEIGLRGDKSGVEAGLIATQLWNKFALSATVSHTQLLDRSRGDKNTIYIPSRIYQAMGYSLSAGYLLLPKEYTGYRQTNLNLYAELLAQQSLDRSAYYIDLAPALQLIFNSTTKLNVGYRFQLKGNMQRMANESWQVGLETIFLNALKKKK